MGGQAKCPVCGLGFPAGQSVCPNDGTPLDRIPLMDGIKQLKDFDLIVLVSAGFPGAKEYVQFAGSRYKLRMIAACTAVSTTDLHGIPSPGSRSNTS